MAKEERVYLGQALVGRELDPIPAEITVKGGMISSVYELKSAPAVWICPAFFDAHTHLGDTIAMDIPCRGTISELVTPPDGLKHRLLARVRREDLIGGMRASVEYMMAGGVAGFADFREGGVAGVLALREATRGLGCRPVILGREGGEEIADGVGISSTRDVSDAREIAVRAKAADKLVAVHAGERDPFDIEEAIGLDPDLIVHCTHAEEGHLRECAERRIPIAVCPRSNWIMGVTASPDRPPIRRMLELGCTVLLGTDNAMFVQPDMFRELSFTSTVYRVDPKVLLRAAIEGASYLASPHFIEPKNRACFFLIRPEGSNLRYSHDICATIVKRVSGCEIGENLLFASHE
ncbi:MAG: amidohydrolase family protein [Methanomicrobiales archaeon]|nr:amidohydrolase family protein [Methanomicrobiales archaeon]